MLEDETVLIFCDELVMNNYKLTSKKVDKELRRWFKAGVIFNL